jgi:hypothetical protein
VVLSAEQKLEALKNLIMGKPCRRLLQSVEWGVLLLVTGTDNVK